MASAFAAGQEVCKPVKPDTIAKSLAIGNPADGPYALEEARSSGGSIDAVSDEEIRQGIRLLAETTGVFTETAGGVTTAVLAKLAARGDIDPDERVVLVITGEGLKTLDAVRGTFETTRSARRSMNSNSTSRASSSTPGRRPMSVTVKLPTQLRAVAGGESEAQLEGDTVGEVLERLFERYGELRERISDERRDTAAVRKHLSRRRGHPFPGWSRDTCARRR